ERAFPREILREGLSSLAASNARMRPHALLPIVLALLAPTAVSAQDRRADRGEGIPTSLFGTYIAGGDVLVYPFYEYTKTSAFEYKASEFGLPGEADFF